MEVTHTYHQNEHSDDVMEITNANSSALCEGFKSDHTGGLFAFPQTRRLTLTLKLPVVID